MKVIFQGNHTADVSEIQSVLVITADKRIEVHLKRKPGETEEKVFDLPILKGYFKKTWLKKLKKTWRDFPKHQTRR